MSSVRLRRLGFYGVPLTAALLAFDPASAQSRFPQPQTQQQSTMRYAEMDANDDGVITRSEWRGTRQAFDTADWNHDGVLSGREIWTTTQSTVRQPGEFDTRIDNNNNGRDDVAERLAYLDTNRNGRVERGEWRGTAASFNDLDRNRDNVLTMGEMRAAVGTSGDNGDVVSARARFNEMDANRDGVIGTSEWNGSRFAFSRQDVNRDGVITRREFMDAAGASGNDNAVGTSGRRTVGTAGEFIRVDSRQQWTDSGVYVNAGDVLTFDADGSAQLSDNQNDVASPDGSRTGRRAERAPLSQNSAGALIARVGNSAPFVVGSQKVMRASSSGQLMIGVNDDYTMDNNGFFRVRIGVR